MCAHRASTVYSVVGILVVTRLARAAGAALLPGCLAASSLTGSSHAASVHTLHITWFAWPPATELQQLGDLYAKQHPGIAIKVDALALADWHDYNFKQFSKHHTDF